MRRDVKRHSRSIDTAAKSVPRKDLTSSVETTTEVAYICIGGVKISSHGVDVLT